MPNVNEELVTYDMYLKHIDKEGQSRLQYHRVWDGERFFASQFEAAKREGGKSSVEMVSEAVYKRSKR